jgi:phage N-6-adenine-methyltransferase
MNSGMNVQTSESDEYETPPWLFKALDTEFRFTFDAAADIDNKLCQVWTNDIERTTIPSGAVIFCNPPYSNIEPFVRCLTNSSGTTVFLLPIRSGTAWFAHLNKLRCWPNVEFRFFRKRIHFLIDGKEPINPKTLKPSGPRFDSMIVVVR